MMNNTNAIENKSQVIEEELEEFREPAAVSTTEMERFIPITRYALMERIKSPESFPDEIYEDVIATLENLQAWRHQVYVGRLHAIMESYLPFSPDSDTVKSQELSEEDSLRKRKDLIGRLIEILERANYEEISDEELDAFFTAQGPYGLNLKVDMTEYDEALVYYRGSGEKHEEKRDWKRLYLKKYTEVIPIFQRLVLALKMKSDKTRIKEIMEDEGLDEQKAKKRLKKYRKNLPPEISSDHIYLKTFKNIPQSDLEMLFPNTKVEFKLLDKIKFYVTAGGGTLGGIIGTAMKLVATTNPITLLIALGGFVGIIIRQVTNFFNQRNRYMMVLAQNLYFHSLANNRGALTLLLDRAEEEDIKEEILLYSYLVHNDVAQGERGNAQGQIEYFLKSEFDVNIKFDFEDALERLIEDGLAIVDDNGVIKAVPPKEARKKLADKWKGVLVAEEQEAPTSNSNAA